MPWSAAVEQIRSGDERSVETLCEAVAECARAQLVHSVDPQAVDDHVQEVLMIVLAAIRSGELRDPHCLMGFVRTVTRRQVTVHIRRAIVRRRRLISVETAATPVAPRRDSPDARLTFQERIAAVGNLLSQLNARDREILIRFYYKDQDSRQICSEMRLTATQFRLYKSRALAKCGERRQSTRPLRIA